MRATITRPLSDLTLLADRCYSACGGQTTRAVASHTPSSVYHHETLEFLYMLHHELLNALSFYSPPDQHETPRQPYGILTQGDKL